MSGYITPPTKFSSKECPMAPLRRRVYSYAVHSPNQDLEMEMRYTACRRDFVGVDRTSMEHVFIIKTFYNPTKFNEWITENELLELVLLE